MNGLGANIYTILPFDDQSTLTMPVTVDEPRDSQAEEDVPELEAFSFESKNPKTLTETYPAEPVPATLFGRMKELLSITIGDISLARQLFGIYCSSRSETTRTFQLKHKTIMTTKVEQQVVVKCHILIDFQMRAPF